MKTDIPVQVVEGMTLFGSTNLPLWLTGAGGLVTRAIGKGGSCRICELPVEASMPIHFHSLVGLAHLHCFVHRAFTTQADSDTAVWAGTDMKIAKKIYLAAVNLSVEHSTRIHEGGLNPNCSNGHHVYPCDCSDVIWNLPFAKGNF